MNFLKFKGIHLTLAFATIIMFFSLLPAEDSKQVFLVSDKLLHFIAYCLLVFPVSLDRVYPQLLVFIATIAFGGFVELIQPFWGREADITDFFANAVGVIFGIIIAKICIIVFKIYPTYFR